MLHSSRSHGSAMTQDYSVEIGGPEEPDAPAGPARAPERGRYVRSAGLGPPTGAPRTKRTVRRRCCGRRGCNRSGWAHWPSGRSRQYRHRSNRMNLVPESAAHKTAGVEGRRSRHPRRNMPIRQGRRRRPATWQWCIR